LKANIVPALPLKYTHILYRYIYPLVMRLDAGISEEVQDLSEALQYIDVRSTGICSLQAVGCGEL
jgi:hypothetical protein